MPSVIYSARAGTKTVRGVELSKSQSGAPVRSVRRNRLPMGTKVEGVQVQPIVVRLAEARLKATTDWAVELAT